MRKSMLVVALALCMCVTAMAQHIPVAGTEECPPLLDEYGNPVTWNFVPLPQFNIMVAAGPVNFAPCAGQYDFCAYADMTFCTLINLDILGEDILQFADLIQCLNMDINGPIDLEAAIPVTGNGMPDAAYELGILAAVLNDATHPLHASVTAAYQEYWFNIKNLVVDALGAFEMKDDKDIRALVAGLAPYLVPSLTSLLAGMATLGDPTTNAALDELLALLSDIGVEPPVGGIASLGTPIPVLGPTGDADDDGFSNRQEYNYCVSTSACSAADFVDAAMDPENVPDIVLPLITLSGLQTRYNIGTDIVITATFNFPPLSYVWKKDAVVLADVTGATLSIPNAQEADAGDYSVTITYDDGSKMLTEAILPFNLNVGVFPVPVAGLFGLSLLAGACAVAGAVGIRRRK